MKPLLFALLSIFLSLVLKAQSRPVDVAENTLKVKPFGEETFYYGFAEGDQMIFSFDEVNDKELKELEIIELPSSSKFMDYKTKKIENKILNIAKTGIYKFRFSNSAVTGRVCRFKIQRIPGREDLKNFDCNVYWRTVNDSSKKVQQERYLVKTNYQAVQILEPSEFFVNSGRNSLFEGGKSRITLPINLPSNTVEWYYTFSATRNDAEVAATKKSMNLMAQLTKLVDQSGALNIGIEMLTKPPGGNVCDVFLVDANNRAPFEAKTDFQYFTEGTRENLTSGVVKVKSSLFSNAFLGIRNPDAGYGIHLIVEAVAITTEEEWGVRDKVSYDVKSRQEAYLKD